MRSPSDLTVDGDKQELVRLHHAEEPLECSEDGQHHLLLVAKSWPHIRAKSGETGVHFSDDVTRGANPCPRNTAQSDASKLSNSQATE